MSTSANKQGKVRSLGYVVCTGFSLAVVVLLFATFAARYEHELESLRSALAALNVQQSVPNGAMWSLGTGGFDDHPYHEWVAVYPVSTLWPYPGAPSLRFTDHAQERADFQRDFEIGFYRYGPTWYSRHFITEFWLGSGAGGILSIAGNDQGGGELQVRNPYDNDSIRVKFTQEDRPVITTESGRALYFAAQQGLISENRHLFTQGLDISPESNRVGVITEGWNQGSITVIAPGVAEDALVFITPTSSSRGQWWLGETSEGESFTVYSTVLDEDMQFQWMVIGTGG